MKFRSMPQVTEYINAIQYNGTVESANKIINAFKLSPEDGYTLEQLSSEFCIFEIVNREGEIVVVSRRSWVIEYGEGEYEVLDNWTFAERWISDKD